MINRLIKVDYMLCDLISIFMRLKKSGATEDQSVKLITTELTHYCNKYHQILVYICCNK